MVHRFGNSFETGIRRRKHSEWVIRLDECIFVEIPSVSSVVITPQKSLMVFLRARIFRRNYLLAGAHSTSVVGFAKGTEEEKKRTIGRQQE